MGLGPEQERHLLALRYPVDFQTAAGAFESVGVDLDTLTDQMGGSPDGAVRPVPEIADGAATAVAGSPAGLASGA